MRVKGPFVQHILNTHGMGISEALVAVGLLAISSVAVVSFISFSHYQNVRQERSYGCQDLVQSVLLEIKSKDHTLGGLECYPWHNAGGTVETKCPGQTRDINYGVLNTDTGAQGWSSFWNIQGATSTLLDIVVNNSAACTTDITNPGMEWNGTNSPWNPGQLIQDELPKLKNAKLFLKVNRITQANTNLACPTASYVLRPKGIPSRDIASVNEDDMFRTTVSLSFDETLPSGSTIPKMCKAETIVGYQGDSSAPVLLDDLGNTNSVSVRNGSGFLLVPVGPTLTSCVTPAPGSRDISMTFRISEKSSTFECASLPLVDNSGNNLMLMTDNQIRAIIDDPAYGITWGPCHTLALGAGILPTISQPGTVGPPIFFGGAQTTSLIKMTYKNLTTDQAYIFAIKPVDPSGNASTTSAVPVRIYMDETRPSGVSRRLRPDGAVIGMPSPNLQGSVWTDGDSEVMGAWGETYFQCTTDSGNGSWQVVTDGALPPEPNAGWANEGCIWNVSGPGTSLYSISSPSGDGCSMTIRPQNCLVNGLYTVTVNLIDVCGGGTASLSENWAVDRANFTSASVGGGNLPQPASFTMNASGTTTVIWKINAGGGNIYSKDGSFNGGGVLPSGPCYNPGGNEGFCAVAYSGCGAFMKASPRWYAVMGQQGERCGWAPCDSGLVCDANGGDYATCQGEGCTYDNGSGSKRCFTSGECGSDRGQGGCSGSPEQWGNCQGICPPGDDVCESAQGEACRDDQDCNWGNLSCIDYQLPVEGDCSCPNQKFIGSTGYEPACPKMHWACMGGGPASRSINPANQCPPPPVPACMCDKGSSTCFDGTPCPPGGTLWGDSEDPCGPCKCGACPPSPNATPTPPCTTCDCPANWNKPECTDPFCTQFPSDPSCSGPPLN